LSHNFNRQHIDLFFLGSNAREDSRSQVKIKGVQLFAPKKGKKGSIEGHKGLLLAPPGQGSQQGHTTSDI
jgi:hypothetical protein